MCWSSPRSKVELFKKLTPRGVACHRLGQCWYSAAAAKTISEETHDEGGGPEDEGEAALALERRLHAPPAIQFVSESGRGGFNKVGLPEALLLGVRKGDGWKSR